MSSEIETAEGRTHELMADVRPLLERARNQAAAVVSTELEIQENLGALCRLTWYLGETLFELREKVGYGRWQTFVAANFPEFKGSDESRYRRAMDACQFYLQNPKFPTTGQFTEDSMRKCIFRLAPEKQRPLLTGNQRITQLFHPLTFVNKWSEWDRKCEQGLAKRPPLEQMQEELTPVIRRMAELLGPDFILGLVGQGT